MKNQPNKSTLEREVSTTKEAEVEAGSSSTLRIRGKGYEESWIGSPERRRFINSAKKYCVIVFGIFALVWMLYGLAWDVGWIEDDDFVGLSTLFMASFAGWGALAVGLFTFRNSLHYTFHERVAADMVDDLHKEESRLVDESEGNLDLASLWLATQNRIDAYHNIATKQANSSFRVGRIAAIAGFVAVLLLGALAALASNGTAAIAASVVGVAGAAMSAYVGATFMKAQAEASAQLRQFFLQPVETSRLLGLERLVGTLEPNQRAEAVMEIVRTMAPEQAQPDNAPWMLQRLNIDSKKG